MQRITDIKQNEQSWLVQDLLPLKGLGLCAAKPKTFKSRLMRQLALSVSRGTPFLDRQTTEGPVLYVSLDDPNDSLIAKHFHDMGVTNKDDIMLVLDLDHDDPFEHLQELIQTQGSALVIVDTLGDLLPCSLGSYKKVQAYMRSIRTIASVTDSHIMCVHHASKGRVTKTMDLSAAMDSLISGSVAVYGAVNTALGLFRAPDKNIYIMSSNRYGVNIEPSVLTLDRETSSMVLGPTLDGAATQIESKELIAQRILGVLGTDDNGKREADLRLTVGGDTGKTGQVLRELCQMGVVERLGDGKRNSPYLYRVSMRTPQNGSKHN